MLISDFFYLSTAETSVRGLQWACIGLSTLPLTQMLFSLIQGFGFEQGFKEATQCCLLCCYFFIPTSMLCGSAIEGCFFFLSYIYDMEGVGVLEHPSISGMVDCGVLCKPAMRR